ncbi:MAG: histidine ammonia-lyase [Negativibacillus sp.]
MLMKPSAVKEIVIDGHSLTIETFVAVARYGAKVSLAPKAMEAMKESRALAEKIAAEKRVAYGITTGFGDFATVAVPEEMSNQLSTNLILSHCTATGDPYSQEVVRGMLLLRANALCGGVSGVRPLLVEMMVEMLNKNVVPVVPQKGSLGASGDLAPLAHMCLPLLGKGRAVYEGVEMDGGEAMAKAGIQTVDTLVCKEGLGLTNGTCAMTSVGTLALYDTIRAAKTADVVASLTMEALTGLKNAFDPRVHQVRGHKGQMQVAKNILLLTEGSEILSKCQNDRVQDAYSLRCIPQVHGAIRDAIEYVRSKVEIELNAVTDNPLMFLDDEAVISGGNFHGEPMALAFDFLGIACSEIADISERRTERMVNAALSNGLTPFLTTQGGVNSGFMIVQYSAASMVSENKVLAHPASVDSIPSSANQEDMVSMGTTAARKSGWILQNTLSVLADELLTACQAIDIRRRLNTHGQGISPVHQKVYELVREKVDFYEIDREIRPDIEAVEEIIRDEKLLQIVDEMVPDFD